MSRILPHILDKELESSSVGEAIVKLEEMSSLIVATRLTKFEIENDLHFSIVEYLDLRLHMIEKIGAPNVGMLNVSFCIYPL